MAKFPLAVATIVVALIFGVGMVSSDMCTGQTSSGRTLYCYGSSYCCGTYYNQVCCNPASGGGGTRGGTIAGSVVGSLVVFAIVIGCIVCCVRGCCSQPTRTTIIQPSYVTPSHVHGPQPAHISYQCPPDSYQQPQHMFTQPPNMGYPPQSYQQQPYQQQPAPVYQGGADAPPPYNPSKY